MCLWEGLISCDEEDLLEVFVFFGELNILFDSTLVVLVDLGHLRNEHSLEVGYRVALALDDLVQLAVLLLC